MKVTKKTEDIFSKISGLIEQARKKVALTINQEMVLLYWNIGKTIREEIMKSKRAEYGEKIVQSLTAQLTQRYGKGFAEQCLWHMVKFYGAYPILSAVQRELQGKGNFMRLSEGNIKVAEYLTKLPPKEQFAEKLHKAILTAQLNK